MFTKPLTYIITKKSLNAVYASINKTTSGIDDITFEVFEQDFNENIASLVKSIQEGTFHGCFMLRNKICF